MADYYPLISRAVTGLENNTGENRRALYERARSALVNQLRGVVPALEESDITRERLALEESIRKVEAEAAKRARPDAEGHYEPPSREDPRPSLRDQGLRDFRDNAAEAEGLGDAAAAAGRLARATYDAVPGDHAPRLGDIGRSPDEQYFQPAEAGAFEHPADPHQHDAPVYRDTPAAAARPPAAEWAAPDEDEEPRYRRRPARSYRRIIQFTILMLLIAAVAAGGYWQRRWIMSTVARLTSSSQIAQKPNETAAPIGRPKITDRVGGTAADSANAPAAAVAQKVVLFDEDPNSPRYVGSALWRTETVSPGPGLAPELAVRADVEIPERRMRMTWSLRRNTDKALPASHTIEIMFTLPADFPEGGIGNVPGLWAKQDEQGRGLPLAGLGVKVTNGYFLIGLSAIEVDVQRNVQLLKERNWFDIPIVYTSGKRAILAIEKGTPGARAFEEAFRAWGQ